MGIRDKSQFQDFCGANPQTHQEFTSTIQKMIAAEERTKVRFGDGRGNQGNYDDYGGNQSNQNRKRRPNNMVTSADKGKKNKPRKFQDLENLPCLWHPNSNHTTADCRNFKNYTRKNDNSKGKDKEHNTWKDQYD
jgi:hypothetical protein